jgi:hypothetical protein
MMFSTLANLWFFGSWARSWMTPNDPYGKKPCKPGKFIETAAGLKTF